MTLTDVKELIDYRAVVTVPDPDREMDLAKLRRAAKKIVETYTLFKVWREGDTVFVDAAYVAKGSNLTQIRRYAANLCQTAGYNVKVEQVTKHSRVWETNLDRVPNWVRP